MIKALITNRRGTALLVALLVMGVLVAVSLALSSLIFRETRVVKDLIDSGRAYYAAEGGIEKALYGLNRNLPGWEPDDDDGDGYTAFEIDREKDAVAEYKVSNRCKAFPCFDEGYDVGSVTQPSEFYGVLDLNESITIPLFVVNGDGVTVTDVEDFAVEFFAKFNPKTDLNIEGTRDFLRGWDVLRWKVFGVNGDVNVTETISDFTALSMADRGEESFLTNASEPSWFGTRRCSAVPAGQRYSTRIGCGEYFGDYSSAEIDGEGIGQISDIFTGNCLHTQAREYYLYEYDGAADKRNLEAENIHHCYDIKQFVEEHTLNYLSLTNLINPAVFNATVGADQREAFSKLYFRVELFPDTDGVGNQTVREFADITSNGYSGKSKQSINVKIKKGSFMPVFHFSLYSTYKTAENGDAYWYGEEEESE